ncbi:SDR family NAD(P)-dependent oxidoreductase [Cryptosporangium sp. NPDC051539]|uniref:type I polyketide synthase n=1 Tax=Cryptosporangium sp. NPDC051539 TaxID=3363962 RepID=UPI00379BD97D
MAPLDEPIAVVGMACRLPGASDLDEFWRTLVEGAESITTLTEEQQLANGVPEARRRNPDYVPAEPMMPGFDRFDAPLFGMTAHEARLCDPQLRVFLETCHAALEHAGYDPFGMDESVGVFGSAGPNDYFQHYVSKQPELRGGAAGMQAQTLNQADYLATFTSYKLNLRGPSMTVQTACSSSLVATHVAAQSLRAGECELALAGAAVVDLPAGRGHLWTPGGVHSADGHCRPFDAAATGTLFGSGAGIVVLRRLDDALAAGDRVLAVIRGSAVNNDGADKVSFSAPSVTGQSEVVAEAMALAGVKPEQIEYVEAHATGTALGDPIEIAALAEAFAGPAGSARTAVGSVKSNIGHLNPAAGIAGLIKTVLMLDREAVVPSINVTELNPRLELDSTPFTVVTELRPWPHRPDQPRYASVSSLGIGGTNAHLVLSDAPRPRARTEPDQPRVLVWSARSEPALEALRTTLAGYFSTSDGRDFADAVATLQHGRTLHAVRAAAVCADPVEAVAALTTPARLITATASPDASTVFLFPGQGSHQARMGIGLYGRVRSFSVAMDECLELFEQAGRPLHAQWSAGVRNDDTAIVQPLLFAVEYALAALWRDWGVEPSAVLGHSIGELAAAAVAGVLDLPDAVRMVHARAQAMARNPVAGGMLAVSAAAEALPELGPLAVAAANGSAQTVLSGPLAALEAAAGELEAAGLRTHPLPVSHAFHHPGWKVAAAEFEAAIAGLPLRPPRIPLYSGATGRQVTAAEAVDPAFWAAQIAQPVQFDAALRSVQELPDRVLLEVGPGRALTTVARRTEGVGATVGGLPGGADEPRAVLLAAAELWTHGADVDWDAAGQPPPARRSAVPGYPYQRERHWIDLPADEPARAEPAPQPARGPFSVIEWVPAARPGLTTPTGNAVVLLPTDADRALRTLLAVERAGYRAVRVRTADRFGESGAEFTVRPGHPGDLRRVVGLLHERGLRLTAFVHALGAGPTAPTSSAALPGALDAAFTSAFTLAKLAVSGPAGHPAPAFVVVTSASVDVSGNDRLEPVKATVLGLVKSLRDEMPGLRTAVLDVADRVSVADLAAELRAVDPPAAVALRGRRRWVAVERPLEVPEVEREAVRDRGVYLITGGFGGLGGSVARALAATGKQPRLILLGRRNPLGDAAPAGVDELRALGAQVEGVAADVTDGPALRAALAEVTGRIGPINGVFHLAGVPGGNMVAFRDESDALAVLAPKTLGAVHLAEALADAPPLDFTVLFSSRAAADGLVGGADYAAGNAFLDALAGAAPPEAGRMLSIGWPVWLGAGMVDPAGPDLTRLADDVARRADGRATAKITTEATYSARTHWMLDEHRVGRTPLLPGTGYLDLVLRVFTERLGTPGRAVRLADVVFRAPFFDEQERLLRLELEPDGDAYRFTVSSERDRTWTLHVSGTVAGVDADAEKVDIAAVRTRMLAADPVGSRPTPGGGPITLGPRWRCVEEVLRSGSEKLVTIALMSAFRSDLDEHRLHPALLDIATAAITSGAEEESYVPVVYHRMTVYADLPGTFYSLVRRRSAGSGTATGDIDLIAPDGTVLARVEGFTMREVQFTEGWDRKAAVAAPTPAEPVPTPAEPVPTPAEPVDGLEPAEGGRLLMRLLAAGSSSSVLVRPHRDGRPLPLAGPGLPSAESVAAVAPGRSVEPAGPAGAGGPAGAAGAASPTAEVAVSALSALSAASAAVPVGAAERLRRLWAESLGAAPTTGDTDFFDDGGDSLVAVELMAKIRAAFGLDLSIGLLLEVRTFDALLSVITGAAGSRP